MPLPLLDPERGVVATDDRRCVTWQLLKRAPVQNPVAIDVIGPEDEDFERIRCPRCHWRPSASSRWCCHWDGPPELRFESCGTTWNTFSTRGRCPGCSHQWQWTSCFQCHQWSLHEDWYEMRENRH